MRKLRESAAERFWGKVSVTQSCWLWLGAKTKSGYGVFQKGRRGEKLHKAHRFSYELHKGPIPEGGLVLHSCDNKACVNPLHLSIGNHSRNLKEAYDRNLRTVGEACKSRIGNLNRKLSSDSISAIFEGISNGCSGADLARKFGVSRSTISKLLISRRT